MKWPNTNFNIIRQANCWPVSGENGRLSDPPVVQKYEGFLGKTSSKLSLGGGKELSAWLLSLSHAMNRLFREYDYINIWV
jgi:hypothetical protein